MVAAPADKTNAEVAAGKVVEKVQPSAQDLKKSVTDPKTTEEVMESEASNSKDMDSEAVSSKLAKAAEKLSAGKKALIQNQPQPAVDNLAEACALQSSVKGDMCYSMCEYYFYYGRALLDLARIEGDVLGNALSGVPDGDDLENSQVENPEKMTEEEKETVAQQVDEALEENYNKVEGIKDGEDKDGAAEAMELGEESKSEKEADEVEEKSDEADKVKEKSADVQEKSLKTDMVEEKSEKSDEAEEKAEKADEAEKKSEKADEAEEKSEKADEAEKKSEKADEAEKKSEKADKAEEESEKAEAEEESDVAEATADEAGKEKEKSEIAEKTEEKSCKTEKAEEKSVKTDEVEEKSDKKDKVVDEAKDVNDEAKCEDAKTEKKKDESEAKVGESKKEEKSKASEAKAVNGSSEEAEKEGEEAADGEAEDAEEDGEEEEGEDVAEEDAAVEGEEVSQESSQEDEEDVSSLQLAWEVLELAKTIYLKREEKSDDDVLKLSQVYLKLGEVCLENENYPESINMYTECLKLQESVLAADDRWLAETHYQLGLAHSLADNFDEAVQQLQAAIAVIDARVKSVQGKLKEEKIELTDDMDVAALSQEQKSWVSDVRELEKLLPELQDKVTDIKDTKASFTEKLKAMKAHFSGQLSGGSSGKSAFEDGASTSSASAFEKPEGAESSKEVKTISTSLIRKKRKPDEQVQPSEGAKKPRVEESAAVKTTKEESKSEESADKKDEPSSSTESDDKKAGSTKSEEAKKEDSEEKMDVQESEDKKSES